MVDINIQMKKRDGNRWENLLPITTSDNVFYKNGSSITAQLDHMFKGPKEHKASFALIDDDGFSQVMTRLKPLLDERDFKGSVAVITGQFEDSRRLNVSQIKQLNDEGWSILSHTHNHTRLTELNTSEIESQMRLSKEALEDIGVSGRGIVYPNNATNQDIVDIARKYFDVGVGYWSNRENLSVISERTNPTPLPTYEINRIGVGAYSDNATWERIKKAIDDTIEHKRLGVLMTHVADNSTEEQALLIQTLDYIQSRGYKVDSFYDAFDKHRNPIEQGAFTMPERSFDFAVDIFGNVDYEPPQSAQFQRPGFNTYVSQYPDGTHHFRYSDSDVENRNSPTGQGGTLTTVVVTGGAGYSYQLFSPYARFGWYMRTPVNDGTWSGWREILLDPGLTRPSFNTTSGNYPKGVHVFNYTNALVDGMNSPLNIGGTLTTYVTGSSVYDYQTFKPYLRDRMFMRGNDQSGVWTAWVETTPS